MPRAIRNLAACVPATLAIVLAGCGGAPSQTVATVGGSRISSALLAHWISVDARVLGGPAHGREGAARSRVLGFLIHARWLNGQARELGVVVSDAQASRRLSRLRYEQLAQVVAHPPPTDREVRRYLVSRQPRRSDQRWLMKLSLIAEAIESKRTQQALARVSAPQVASFYLRHHRAFLLPELRDIEILGNYHLAVVQRAKREIEAGESFLALARRVSVDTEAPTGIQRSLRHGIEERVFIRVVFDAKPGTLVGPIKQTAFYFLFKVIKVTPARYRTLAQAERSIRRRLAAQVVAGRTRSEVVRTWTARTRCAPGYVAEQCGR